MKIWTVWFSDCFNTTYKSCSVFPCPPKLVEVYEIWIIVCIWAFFLSVDQFRKFLQGEIDLGLQNQIFRFGLTKYMWICFERPRSKWRVTFFIIFFRELFFSCFLNLQWEMMIDADIIPPLYNLELISIFPLKEDTK